MGFVLVLVLADQVHSRQFLFVKQSTYSHSIEILVELKSLSSQKKIMISGKIVIF